jgi:hypothetical protein
MVPYEGAPALPNTGALLILKPDGTFSVVVNGLNTPTSMEIIGNSAYVVSLVGDSLGNQPCFASAFMYINSAYLGT